MRARTSTLVALPVAFLALFFAYPMGHALAPAFDADAWTWALDRPYLKSRLVIALAQAAASMALALAVAIPLAWLHHARRIPFSRAHLAIHAAPFVLPVFVVVFGVHAFLPEGTSPFVAVVVAHAYYNYGFAARLLHAALERRARRLEDAALTLGASGRGAFLRVTLPLLLPAFAATGLLVFLFSFSSFGVVLFLGEGEVATLETVLYENMGGAFPAYDRAALVGLLQLAINVVLLLTYTLLSRRAFAAERAPPVCRAGAWAQFAAWGSLVFALAPVIAVLVGGFRVSGEWSLEAWSALVDPAHPAHVHGFDLGRALGLSLGYAAVATVAALALTAALAYGLRALGPSWRRAVESLAALPLGASSLLLGFGYLLAFGTGAGALDLRGSVALVVVAHTLVAFPFVARVLVPALDAHDPRLDEAAATLGASPFDVARRVHWPLLKPAILAAAGIAAAVSLGDFGASLVLMRPENMGLSVWIARHGGAAAFNPVLRSEALALSGLLMALAALAAGLLALPRARRAP